MDFTNLPEKIQIAEEQLEKVKQGKKPTDEGKYLIGKLSLMKCMNTK
tara:strand:- start:521 stop:661 length:141 start_codon:yes stop_codon:yes gene_type:complete